MTHRARVLLTERWAKQWPHLTLASVHPGWVDTPGLASAGPMATWYSFMRPSLRNLDQGADTILWLASPATTTVESGSYYWDRRRRPVDLSFAGTSASEGDVNGLVSWLDAACP